MGWLEERRSGSGRADRGHALGAEVHPWTGGDGHLADVRGLSAIEGPAPRFSRRRGSDGGRRGKRSAAAGRRQHPFRALSRKELRRQQLSFVVAGLFLLAASPMLLVFEPGAADGGLPLSALMILCSGLLAPLIRSLGSAEQRQLGTLEWQSSCPFRCGSKDRAGVPYGQPLVDPGRRHARARHRWCSLFASCPRKRGPRCRFAAPDSHDRGAQCVVAVQQRVRASRGLFPLVAWCGRFLLGWSPAIAQAGRGLRRPGSLGRLSGIGR